MECPTVPDKLLPYLWLSAGLFIAGVVTVRPMLCVGSIAGYAVLCMGEALWGARHGLP